MYYEGKRIKKTNKIIIIRVEEALKSFTYNACNNKNTVHMGKDYNNTNNHEFTSITNMIDNEEEILKFLSHLYIYIYIYVCVCVFSILFSHNFSPLV